MNKTYVYMKKNDSMDDILSLLKKANLNVEQCELYTDVNRDYIAYAQLKKTLLREKGLLIISSLNAIGTTKLDVYKELIWCQKHEICLVIVDYPATHIFNNALANKISLDVLVDVYSSLQENKNFDIRSAEKAIGRKKINFPENWAELYENWNSGKITAKEFMEQTGLKKGTFYHLVNDYKELLEINKDTFTASV